MIDGITPYPKTKPSNVEWLGDVPVHWEVRRLRNLARTCFSNVDKHSKDGEQLVRLCNYSDVYYKERIRNDLDFMVATATAEEIGKYQLHAGDVLITKDSESWDDIGVPAFVESTDHDIVCGYHLALLRPRKGRAFGKFLCRALSGRGIADQFFVRANGVTRFGLSQIAIRSVWLPTPPLPEQAAIACFLDHVDQRITRCISAKEKLIALLEEYRQTVVSEAVTGRFDVRTGKPYPAYRPSGVKWLGDVPAHWEVRRLKYLSDLIMGQSPPSEECSAEQIGLPFLQGCAEFGSEHPRPVQYCRSPAKVSPAGAILISVRAPVGRLNVANQPYGIGRGLCAVIPQPRFLDFQCCRYGLGLSSTGLIMQSTGSTFEAVSIGDVASLPMAMPPLPEQTAIARFLDGKIEKIQVGIARAQGEIDLLREYRTRLIADVVTGKLDVRAAAAELPESDATVTVGADGAMDCDDVPALGSPDRAA